MGYMPPEQELPELEDELRRVRSQREQALRGLNSLRARELVLMDAISGLRRELAEDDAA